MRRLRAIRPGRARARARGRGRAGDRAVPGDAAALRALRRARRGHRPRAAARRGRAARRARAEAAAHRLERRDVAAPVAAHRRPRRERRPSTTCTPTSPCPADEDIVLGTGEYGAPFVSFVGARQGLRRPVPPGEVLDGRPDPPAQLREHRNQNRRSRDPLPRDRHLRGQGRAASPGQLRRRHRLRATTRSEAARSWMDAGARFLHVVDLDGARHGSPRSLHHLERIKTRAGRARSSTAAACARCRRCATRCARGPTA